MEEDEKLPQGEILFLQVVSMFQAAAVQQMGKIPSPLTGRIERDLEQAKMSVDILAMLKEKTAGNLTKRESGYLGKALFECQMNYLDELKRPAPEAAEGGDGEGSAEGSPEGGGNARPGAGGGGEDEKGEER